MTPVSLRQLPFADRSLFIAAAATLLLAIGVAGAALAGVADDNFDPETGYRIAHYRAAVPPEVPGGKRIWLDDIERLVEEEKAVLLDVMPATGFGYDPRTGKWRLSKAHDNIPGSTWLPDVGRGRISRELDRYFRDNLRRLTGGDPSRALIIYCQSDCWMGWNAVQRARSYGYRTIYWYPEGIDGWRDWDREAVPAVPVPVEIEDPKAEGH